MVDVNKLKKKINEKNTCISELSVKLGIDKSTLYRKIKVNGETFLIREVDTITKELQLTPDEAIAIFFTQNVSCDATKEKQYPKQTA